MTQKPAMYHADCGGRISNETMHCDKCQQQVNDSSQWVQPTATEEMQAAVFLDGMWWPQRCVTCDGRGEVVRE